MAATPIKRSSMGSFTPCRLLPAEFTGELSAFIGYRLDRYMLLQLVEERTVPAAGLRRLGTSDAMREFGHGDSRYGYFNFAEGLPDTVQELFYGLPLTLRFDDNAGVKN
jgi:hypothetical protein